MVNSVASLQDKDMQGEKTREGYYSIGGVLGGLRRAIAAIVAIVAAKAVIVVVKDILWFISIVTS
jgi:hypothetical protein